MLGATKTANGPVVAPNGIVMPIEVLLQELIVTNVPFKVTILLPCETPNPVPVMTTWSPIGPAAAETLLITGVGVAAEFIDTLSNVAVARLVLSSLLKAKPM
jgi:hypothetical protein